MYQGFMCHLLFLMYCCYSFDSDLSAISEKESNFSSIVATNDGVFGFIKMFAFIHIIHCTHEIK